MAKSYKQEMDMKFAKGHGMEIPNLDEMRTIFPDAADLLLPSRVYEFLEGKMRKYADYAKIETQPNGEKLVPIKASSYLVSKQIGEDMRPITGEDVFVREQVLERLLAASNMLGKVASDSRLEVVYGYRALSIQTALFERIKRELLSGGFNGSNAELLEAVHRIVAVPDVAGHPTGGAVDIQIIKDGQLLNMGTPIWVFVEDSYTFSPYIGIDAWANRQLLRDVMVEAEFVPFDGEWWHYSYGDVEWAAAVQAPYAIYDQIEFRSSQ